MDGFFRTRAPANEPVKNYAPGSPERKSIEAELAKQAKEVIEIPCIVMAGSDIASVEAVAATGAEFVAASAAVFAEGVDPRAAVARANDVLDRTAPRFEE